MIGVIAVLSAIILLGVILCLIGSFDIPIITFFGCLFIALGIVGFYYAGREYYESKIPNIQEQVQLYNIQVAEEKLLEFKGGIKE